MKKKRRNRGVVSLGFKFTARTTSLMADESAPQVPTEHEPKPEAAADTVVPAEENFEDGGSKRAREEEVEPDEKGEKKAKIEDAKTVESSGDGNGKMEKDVKGLGRATVGPKTFGSSVEIFDYFYKLLHAWPTNLNINKYEHIMLLELLQKGHTDAERKIGKGIEAFQVRFHPQFKSRCFFLTKEDGSTDDFSFRKCVDHILPLPENMQIKNDTNKALRGKGGKRKK
ncbi:hypothetical protein STAS_02825 [Striga asiatica]|uniref:Uncharacterized protein n=1 Tax=Striga asiatica TaxID=4170 RepID=A0A5A7P327_STRAF|nr:hypothetical protein STAS_02825 [Striga asiatica]